jgi:hypothetical protein
MEKIISKAFLKKCPNCEEIHGVQVHFGTLVMEIDNLFFLCSVNDDWEETMVPVAVIDDNTLGFIIPPHDGLPAEYMTVRMDDVVECEECEEKRPLRDFVELGFANC